jgi:hypothetical protein
MECFICTESNPKPIHLGCACRSDLGFAHVECMAKFIRISQHFSRKCPTCKQKLTSEMLHYLNGYFTGEGDLVYNIQKLAEQLVTYKIPIIRFPVNDQKCFRVLLSNTNYLALSILACKPNNVNQEHFFQTLLIDKNDLLVMSSIKTFNKVDTNELIYYIQNIMNSKKES